MSRHMIIVGIGGVIIGLILLAAAIAVPVPGYRMLDRRLRQARGRRGPAPSMR